MFFTRVLQQAKVEITGDLINIAKFSQPQIGNFAELRRVFTLDDTKAFSKLSGDNNPIHINSDYAKSTSFKKPIVQGILCSGLFSTIFGSQLPGSIYISQNLKFRAPAYLNETITARVEVKRFRERVNVLVCETTCRKDDGTIVIQGEAEVLLPKTQ